ncbi:dexamethasone-induced Ras-related protein 1 [Galendromus occidentalis]|uniref:Dexamethasone-induced Ras-related protein 1 n=1 Tax=Galendromus occidentalis TaxID=34638 RepID=A0AAJ6VUR0_9ACAR|nr:dexamethasone-induced Ras-related protein 1 [Galendromus occidentalis]
MPGKTEILPTIDECSAKAKDHYKLVVLGDAKVGKTSIIHRFLYDKMPAKYRATVEEFHQGEFDMNGTSLTLNIVDTSGTYPFPAMRRLAITTGDAFVLVYGIDSQESFEQVRLLRDEVLQFCNKRAHIIVVGNKCDLEERRQIKREIAETLVEIDWEHGFIEASAERGVNVIQTFKKLMNISKIPMELTPKALEKQRRKSLPVHNTQPTMKDKTLLKRNSCNVS